MVKKSLEGYQQEKFPQGKQKADLVEEIKESSEEGFGPRENTDYYDPDTYTEQEDRLFDYEPDASFTPKVTSLVKSSGPQCRTCLICFGQSMRNVVCDKSANSRSIPTIQDYYQYNSS